MMEASLALQRAGLDDAAAALTSVRPELRETSFWKYLSAQVALRQGQTGEAFEFPGDVLGGSVLRSSEARELTELEFLKALSEAVRSQDVSVIRKQIAGIRREWPKESVAILASLILAAKAEDYELAWQELEHLEEVDQDRHRPAFWRANLLAAEGKMHEARKALAPILNEEHLNDSPSSGWRSQIPARMLNARIALFLDQPGEALVCLREPSPDEPIETVLLRAEVLRRLKQTDTAVAQLESFVKRNPNVTRAWLMLSRVHEDSGPVGRAESALQRGLTALPGNRRLQDRLLYLMIDRNAVGAAEELALGIYRSSPELVTAVRLAGLFLNASLSDPADAWLTKAREVNKGKPSPMLDFLEVASLQNRAETSGDRELFEQARQRLMELLKASPENIGLMNNLAWLQLRGFDRPDEAAVLIGRIRAQVRDQRLHPGVLDTVLETLRATGQHEEALNLISQSLIKFPDEAILRFHHGVFLMESAGNDAFFKRKAARELERAQMLGGLSKSRQNELRRYLREWAVAYR